MRNKKEEKEITLLRKSIYGRDLYYPDCSTSRLICDLAGKKTLSKEMIIRLKEEGYNLTYQIVSASGKDLEEWIQVNEEKEEEMRQCKIKL